ncbi:MAG: AMP-binding protein, partial [Pseudarcicella sp.]|nr:AMP-binding protein [Pseudarcicella sp.]
MLIINNFFDLPQPKTDYEKLVVSFCVEWLSGKEEFIIKTSGSTGEPKNIIIKRKQLVASALKTIHFFELKSIHTFFVALNVSYVAGMMMLVRAMQVQAKAIIVEPSNNPLLALSKDVKIDFAAFVPTQVSGIFAQNGGFDLFCKIKNVIIGGAAISESLEEKLKIASNNVFATYGMTETVSHIAIRKINTIEKSNCFRLLSHVKIGIDDRKCLTINADVTDFETIVTNDLVEIIDELHFKLLGRLDNIINSGGVKIQLEKIEKTISENLPSNLQSIRFFAFGVHDELLGQKLVVVFESKPFENEQLELLKKTILTHSSKYEMPKAWFFVNEFTETQTQKIDKISIIKSLNCSLNI